MGKTKKRTLSETSAEESKQKATDNDEEYTKDPKAGEIIPEVPAKKPKLFMVKEFRQQIKSDSKILAMKSFHSLCASPETSQEAIHDYLKFGGSCLELLHLLEGETNIPQVQILECVYHILLRIIAKYPQQQTNAFEACRYLLNTHINMINKMLGLASSGKERRVMLKLLTAIVTFSAGLAKDVLIHVKFHSGNLEVLTRNTGETDSVRNAFIHFLIAFLVDGHYPTISMLLEKQGLLGSIVRGLQYDLADSVCLIMLTFKKNILENPLVSKTVKMKTFSTPVVRDIVNLYNWKGPKGFDPKKNAKRLNVEVDEYDKSRVSGGVHEFLLVLCTSVKYGVIFKDKMLGIGKKHQNALMFTVLESLDRPWEHSYACELVTKICAACPDLVKTMWANLKAFLEPRVSVKWLNAVKFAKTLLKEIQPGCVEHCWRDYNPQQYAQMMQFLVAPTPILKTILPETDENTTPETNHVTLSLLQDMLESIEAYLEAAKRYFPPDYNNTLRRIVQQHISTNFPNGLKIIKAWNEVPVEFSEGFRPYTPSENLDVALNVLDFYDKLCPQMLDNLLANFSLTNLLAEISDETLQIKVVKLFLSFEPTLFNPSNDLFDYVLPLLLRNYSNNSIGLETLRVILKNTGIFEGCDSEINVWIDSIFELKHFDESVADFIVNVVKLCSKNLLQFLGGIVELKSESNAAVVDNVAEIIDGLNECDVVAAKNTVRHVYFSPMILAGLDSSGDSNKAVKMYFNQVLLNLFHLQTDFRIFANLLLKYEPVIAANTWNYFAGWIGNEATVLVKIKGKLDLLPKLSAAILQSEAALISEVNLNAYRDLRLNLLQTVIFYLTNLNEAKYLQVSLDLVGLCDDRLTVLSNPVLLQRFNVLNKNLQTDFIIGYVRNYKIDGDHLNPYRNKLFNTVMKLLQKSKLKSNEGLIEIIELFGLDRKECEAVLDQFATLSIEGLNDDALTEFYNILSYALQKFCDETNYLPLRNDTFEKICILKSQIDSTNLSTAKLTSNINNYLNRYPHHFKTVPTELFLATIQKDYCKEAAVLSVNILKNRPDFLQHFENNLQTIAAKKGLFLPMLDCVYKLQPDPDLLQRMYKSFENSIAKTLQKPQKAGQHFENNPSIVKLIGSHVPGQIYLEKIQKYETSEPFLAQILACIYLNYIGKNEIDEKCVNNAILTFVHLVVTFYKRKIKSEDDWKKLASICSSFSKFLDKLGDLNIRYDQVKSNETFKLFCKFTLKFGLTDSACSLNLLSRFIGIVKFDDEEAGELMEMAVSHSEFMNVVLNDDSDYKREVLGLILGLCSVCSKVMKRDHVPVLLGAYGATMSESDQLILQLLKIYESQPAQTNFYDFKPFLWGTAARNHYTLRSDIQKSIWRQPRTSAVLDILHEPWIINTITHYPLNMSFQSKNIAPTETSPPIYDLRFLLPLFSQLLAPENSIQTYKFSRSGALSLTIIALSSNNEEIRKSACHILARFYYHLEAKGNGKDNLLWIRFIEAICRGTAILNNFKLNNFSAILLSKMALILTNPKDLMYTPLSFYLGARSTPDLSSIPELYTFLRSPDVNYKEHRLFIFEILRDGLRQDSDFSVSLKSMAYKLIMETYTSSIADYECKIMILQVLQNACLHGAQHLCNYHGLVSWLYTVTINAKENAVVAKIIQILYNIVKCKNVDLVMMKVVFSAVLDKIFAMKLKPDYIVCLLKCLIALQESKVIFLDDFKIRRIVKFVNNDLCEYMLDYDCVVDVDGDLNVDYYVKLLTCNFINDKK